jgi:predicted RNA binding protein YcfA (HicA-like mRNA interferase family)
MVDGWNASGASHHIFSKSGERRIITVPVHGNTTLKPGLASRIARDAGIKWWIPVSLSASFNLFPYEFERSPARRASSNARGQFRFDDLQPGRYSVTVNLKGVQRKILLPTPRIC